MAICFDGNIGAGKSTLISILGEKFKIPFFLEPVEKWETKNKNNNKSLLDLFYSDISRYGYLFQSVAFITRSNMIDDGYKQFVSFFVERSVFADRYCFAENLKNSNQMNDIEYEYYTEWFDTLVNKFELLKKIKGIVYVRTNYKNCYDRLNKRNRSAECGIPLDYLLSLEKMHDFMFKEVIPRKYNLPILEINGDIDFKTNEENQYILYDKILTKFML